MIAEADYAALRILINRELSPAEKEFIDGRKAFEADFSSVYAKDKKEAQRKLTAYVADAFAKINDLYDKILKKLPGT